MSLDEGTTVGAVLEVLDIRRRVVISVNDIHEPDHSRELQDGDRVRIFSSVSGGLE